MRHVLMLITHLLKLRLWTLTEHLRPSVSEVVCFTVLLGRGRRWSPERWPTSAATATGRWRSSWGREPTASASGWASRSASWGFCSSRWDHERTRTHLRSLCCPLLAACRQQTLIDSRFYSGNKETKIHFVGLMEAVMADCCYWCDWTVMIN